MMVTVGCINLSQATGEPQKDIHTLRKLLMIPSVCIFPELGLVGDNLILS
jgi:hypothetical protein